MMEIRKKLKSITTLRCMNEYENKLDEIFTVILNSPALLAKVAEIFKTIYPYQKQNVINHTSILMTSKEAQDALGVSRKTLYNLTQENPSIKANGLYAHGGFIPAEILKLKNKRLLAKKQKHI